MNTSFTQKHIEELPLNDVTPQQFLHLAIQTCKSLGWILSNTNDTGFIAYTNNGIFNWNAEVKLKIVGGYAKLVSQSRNIRAVEFEKDKINIDNFIAAFKDIKQALIPSELSESYSNLQSQVA